LFYSKMKILTKLPAPITKRKFKLDYSKINNFVVGKKNLHNIVQSEIFYKYACAFFVDYLLVYINM